MSCCERQCPRWYERHRKKAAADTLVSSLDGVGHQARAENAGRGGSAFARNHVASWQIHARVRARLQPKHGSDLERAIQSFCYRRPKISLRYNASIAGTNKRARICAFTAPLVSTT